MLVIPCIDVRTGSCVRWTKGKPETEVVYSRDPLKVALHWKEKGATRLHFVDLDGALSGQPHYIGMAGELQSKTGLILEYGGGLRSTASVRKAFETGIDKVILGTVLLEHAGWVKEIVREFPGRVIVALDASEGKVLVEGWTKETNIELHEMIKQVEGLGVREMIYTDINKDGTLQGPNFDMTSQVVSWTWMKVYASGGISSIDDIKRLKGIPKLAGCVIGRALYTGAVDLAEAIAAAK